MCASTLLSGWIGPSSYGRAKKLLDSGIEVVINAGMDQGGETADVLM